LLPAFLFIDTIKIRNPVYRSAIRYFVLLIDESFTHDKSVFINLYDSNGEDHYKRFEQLLNEKTLAK
jgi:hypothetical protein